MKYLGVDFGLKRLGLAQSDGELAAPFKIIEVKGFKYAVQKIVEVVSKEGFEKIIVGMPEGKMGQTVKGFIKALRKNGLNVEESDETLSSKKALEKMINMNIPQKKRQAADDIAAAIILQNWLDR